MASKNQHYSVIGQVCRPEGRWLVAQIGLQLFVFPEEAESVGCKHRYKDWEALKRDWPDAVRLRG